MTGALYSRIEAIESFAADVAHELRNPLTSLRSAVETLPMAKTDANRKRLLDVIEHSAERGAGLVRQILGFARDVLTGAAREQVEPWGRSPPNGRRRARARPARSARRTAGGGPR